MNDAPTISSIGSQSINEDTTSAALAFVVADVDTPATTLVVSATSSDQTLIADSGIVIRGTGANRTISYTPVANANGGPTVITVSVFDGEATTTTSFDVTVNAIDDAPTLSVIGKQTISEDSGTSQVAFSIGDVDSAPGASCPTLEKTTGTASGDGQACRSWEGGGSPIIVGG